MSEILSLLSGGIIGGILGAFLGGFAKFFWGHWLPNQLMWRREQKIEREKLLSQFRDPAIRATSELQGRVFRILLGSDNYEYLREHGLEDYYIISTVFLVAQFFAWVELLRQKTSMLDYSELTMKFEETIHSFSGGRPGFQIFRLEQREIGERMLIAPTNSNLYCLGYADFIEKMKGDNIPACFSRLETNTRSMLDDPLNEMMRLAKIQHALIELIDFLDPEARWIPKKRDKFDVRRQLDKLGRSNLPPIYYTELINQAKNAEFIDENTANQLKQKSQFQIIQVNSDEL